MSVWLFYRSIIAKCFRHRSSFHFYYSICYCGRRSVVRIYVWPSRSPRHRHNAAPFEAFLIAPATFNLYELSDLLRLLIFFLLAPPPTRNTIEFVIETACVSTLVINRLASGSGNMLISHYPYRCLIAEFKYCIWGWTGFGLRSRHSPEVFVKRCPCGKLHTALLFGLVVLFCELLPIRVSGASSVNCLN